MGDENKFRNVHDKLFQAIFSDPAETASLLKHYLSDSLVADMNWSTLQPVDKKYINEIFGTSESDLLFQVRRKGSDETNFLYLLFEHQSTQDHWMAFRMLKYACRIWDCSFKLRPKQKKLPPILPIVFYQGEKQGWEVPVQMLDLIENSPVPETFLPRYSYFLIDQSEHSGKDFVGDAKAQIAQALLWAKNHGQIDRILEEIGDSLRELGEKPVRGLDYFLLAIRYIYETQDVEMDYIDEKVKSVQTTVRGKIVTGAERYRAEGKAEGEAIGEIRGKLKTIMGMLRRKIDWEIITDTTGISRGEYEKLMEEMLGQT